MSTIEQDHVMVEGTRVALPVEVRAARMVASQFLVDADAAQRLVDPTGLQVLRQRGGKALCALSAVDYSDNDLGDYNEIALALVVEPHDATGPVKPSMSSVTTYIHRLPVDQHFTCAAGKGIWGFPKWVTDISYVQRSGATEVTLIEDGEVVLGYEARRGWFPVPSKPMEMACYSLDDEGVLRRTPWTTRPEGTWARPGGTRLHLGSRHPMARELASLGLPKRALVTMTTRNLSATFGLPEIVER